MITAVAGAAALATAFGAGVLVAADEPDVASPPTVRTPPIELVNADLAGTASCDDLLDSYVQRAIDQVGPWGWGMGGDVVFSARESDASASKADAGTATAPTTTRATNSETGTNVQEAGVDEPDVVKTDGEHVFRIEDDELTTYDATGTEVTELASLDLDGISEA